MHIHGIHHIQLAFPHERESEMRHFYASFIGLTELRPPVAQPDGILRFVAGQQRIDLVPTENWVPPPAVSHLALAVQDQPKLRRRLLAAEVRLEERHPLAGHLRFYTQDPAGNPLEFLEPDPSQASTV